MNIDIETNTRINRARIEWLRILDPFEYVLLDIMLFRSNLTEANHGEGYKFHVRTLARETGISVGKVCQLCRKWPFVKKCGTTKGMLIQMDYSKFQTWIVHLMNNDCSPGEPISNIKNCTVLENTVHSVNNKNEPSEARSEPKAILHSRSESDAVLTSINSFGECIENKQLGRLEAENHIPIVHQVNNKKSVQYVASANEPIPLPLPYNIPLRPSIARQNEILRQLNNGGFNFSKDSAMGTERDGYKFCAVDETEKFILITADDKSFLTFPKVQAMCRHFKERKYGIMLWTAKEECIFKVVKENVPGQKSPAKAVASTVQQRIDPISEERIKRYLGIP